MNPIFSSFLTRYTKNRTRSLGHERKRVNKSDLKIFQRHIRQQFAQSLLILLGILSAGLGLKGFLLPNGFIDGGVTGTSLLISELTGINLSILIFIINIPFIYLGYKQFDTTFAVKTFLAIVMLALTVHFLEFPVITNDKLLVAVFGGVFLGGGIGLAVRGGCVIDGTEVLAVTINRRSPLTIGDVILIINLIIFSVAAFFLSWERALYSVLTYMAAAKTIDYVISGIEEHTGVTIISSYSNDIRLIITKKLGRGVTIYKGKRGYGNRGDQLGDMDIIFTVITRLELSTLKSEVEKIDPSAFLVAHSINDTKGGMIKKKPLH